MSFQHLNDAWHDDAWHHERGRRPRPPRRSGRHGRRGRRWGGPFGGQFGPFMPPMAPGFGHGPWGGPRSGRAKRGDVRAAILALLAEGPRNGYRIMQEIDERSQRAWRPSPGAVYPALQQLTEEGLIHPVGEGRRTMFELTDEGRTYIAEHPDEVDAPWEAMTPDYDEDVVDLMGVAQQTAVAFSQVISAGSSDQLARARTVLDDARRALYQILADGEPRQDESPSSDDD